MLIHLFVIKLDCWYDWIQFKESLQSKLIIIDWKILANLEVTRPAFDLTLKTVLQNSHLNSLKFRIVVAIHAYTVSVLVVLTNHIHVSGDGFSHDHKGCGSLKQPCASIQYAINISSNFDTILLNSDYVYYQNKTLVIDKSINITSYTTIDITADITTTNHRTIIFNLTDHSNFIFQISDNLSMRNLKIQILTTKFQKQMTSEISYRFVQKHWTLNWISTKFQINESVTKHSSETHNILFQDCIFNQTSLSLDISNNITFINCKFFSSSIWPNDAGQHQVKLYVNVKILNCTFKVSTIIFDVTLLHRGNITINNTIFDGTLIGPLKQQLHKLPQLLSIMDTFGSFVNLTITFCTFQNSLETSVIASQAKGMITIKNTRFLNNTFKFPENAQVLPTTYSAALTILSGDVEIHNCTFRNNSGPQTQTGSLQGTPNSEADSFGPKFKMTKTVIEAGVQPFTMENTVVFLANTDMTDITDIRIFNVNLTCPKNHQEKHTIGYSRIFIFKCIRCKSTSYNVKDISGINLDNISHILEHNTTTCFPCPYQASCIDEIRSRGNYWGSSNSSGAVTFYLCPPSYCCSSLATCTSYDTCAVNRKGRLCGDCVTGHSLTLFGHNRCVPSQNCIVESFWFGYAFAAVMICLFVMYSKEVVSFVKSTVTRACSKGPFNARMVSLSSVGYETESQYELLLPDSVAGVKISSEQANISGLLKISFFFYQTASITRINASAKTMYNMPPIIDLLTSLFNVKIDTIVKSC